MNERLPGPSDAQALRAIRRRRGLLGWVLLALPTGYFLVLFAAPMLGLLRTSFAQPVPGSAEGVGWTLLNYAALFATPLYRHALWVTLRIGLTVSLFALLLGYPLALFLARTRSAWRGTLLFLILMPILVSVVVRAYGWIVLLSNRGLVNSALRQFGLIHRPLRLIFNETGVVIGTTHVLLPFMVLSVLGSLSGLDERLEEAAASLGAHPFRVFRDVVVPLSLPGVGAGLLLVFILAVSSFVTPVLLGGQLVMTIPILALQQFGSAFDWPLGSALVVMLLTVVIAITLVYDTALQRRLQRGRR